MIQTFENLIFEVCLIKSVHFHVFVNIDNQSAFGFLMSKIFDLPLENQLSLSTKNQITPIQWPTLKVFIKVVLVASKNESDWKSAII